MLKLNEEGIKYLDIVTKQMKDLKIYLEGDSDIMLKDMALQYQLYRTELEMSLNEDNYDQKSLSRHHMNMGRHLKIVQDMQKQCGLGPLQRNKLKAFREIKEEEENIFDKISSLMED